MSSYGKIFLAKNLNCKKHILLVYFNLNIDSDNCFGRCRVPSGCERVILEEDSRIVREMVKFAIHFSQAQVKLEN